MTLIRQGNYLLDVQFRIITDVEFRCDGQSEVRSARTLIGGVGEALI